ncbi:MAG: LysR substrate-binding domain-containing protein [Bdellovibrionales bacterium]
MDISWLTIRDLQYIVAVAETSHFGQAAKQCNVSQPALSTQIKKCETLLGVDFFERTKRKVLITESGQKIVEQAKNVLREAQKMAEVAHAKTSPLTGQLRLGGIVTISPYLTPYYLSPLKKAYPQLELRIHEGYTDTLLKDLKKGSLDMVIASPTFDEAGFELTHLYFEPFLLAYPVGHPVGNIKDLTPNKLTETDMVLLSDGHCLSDQVLQACSKMRGKSSADFQATSLMTLLQIVATGTGYTVIPTSAAIEDSRLKGLVKFKDFSNKKTGRIVTLVTREGSSMRKDVEAFKEVLQKHLPHGTTKL